MSSERWPEVMPAARANSLCIMLSRLRCSHTASGVELHARCRTSDGASCSRRPCRGGSPSEGGRPLGWRRLLFLCGVVGVFLGMGEVVARDDAGQRAQALEAHPLLFVAQLLLCTHDRLPRARSPARSGWLAHPLVMYAVLFGRTCSAEQRSSLTHPRQSLPGVVPGEVAGNRLLQCDNAFTFSL